MKKYQRFQYKASISNTAAIASLLGVIAFITVIVVPLAVVFSAKPPPLCVPRESEPPRNLIDAVSVATVLEADNITDSCTLLDLVDGVNVVSTSGCYTLNNSMTLITGLIALQITASNVTIHGNGQTLQGRGNIGTVDLTIGVDASGQSNVRVENLIIRDFSSIGVLGRGVVQFTLDNLLISDVGNLRLQFPTPIVQLRTAAIDVSGVNGGAASEHVAIYRVNITRAWGIGLVITHVNNLIFQDCRVTEMIPARSPGFMVSFTMGIMYWTEDELPAGLNDVSENITISRCFVGDTFNTGVPGNPDLIASYGIFVSGSPLQTNVPILVTNLVIDNCHFSNITSRSTGLAMAYLANGLSLARVQNYQITNTVSDQCTSTGAGIGSSSGIGVYDSSIGTLQNISTDLMGADLYGIGANFGAIGVRMSSVSNVYVNHLTATNSQMGIYVNGSNNLNVSNTNLFFHNRWGGWFENVVSPNLYRVVASGNQYYGLLLLECGHGYIDNSTANDNGCVGIYDIGLEANIHNGNYAARNGWFNFRINPNSIVNCLVSVAEGGSTTGCPGGRKRFTELGHQATIEDVMSIIAAHLGNALTPELQEIYHHVMEMLH
jgi:hypothetical protein